MAPPGADHRGPFWRVFPWSAASALRGKREVRRGHLRRKDRRVAGLYHPLALVETWIPAETYDALPDLGDPHTLARLDVRPDDLGSRERTVTQRISRSLHDAHGLPGFRWWSAFGGQWHVAVLYLDRVEPHRIRYGTPDPLHLAHPVVHAAAGELGLRVAKP
ncbi:MAG TPA: hypothetical protein VF263_19115 [Longimicrobiaceae bacterium]